MDKIISPGKSIRGTPKLPGDKSISHRALMLSSLAQGRSELYGLSRSEDVQATQDVLRMLGVKIQNEEGCTRVRGVSRLRFSQESLDCQNSGTTMRLLMGLIAGQGISATLVGDASLLRRPMRRVAKPLAHMGAILTLREDQFAPIHIQGGGRLRGFAYELPLASAQVKSALLLAGLFAEGSLELTGCLQSRDHTERLLPHFGVTLQQEPARITLIGGQCLQSHKLDIPKDFSAAAFWIVAAVLLKNSDLKIQDVGLNPTRTGLLRVLQAMGLSLELEQKVGQPEPVGSLRIRHSLLQGVHIDRGEVPFLIDEIPLLAILASQAHGVTTLRGAEELQWKESHRLKAVEYNLSQMGCQGTFFEDGFEITGPQILKGNRLKSFQDHRIVMAFAIAGLVAEGETILEDAECVRISDPNFFSTLRERVIV